MANTKSAIKNIRKTATQTTRNTRIKTRLKTLKKRVTAAAESVEIVQTQYRSGLVDFQRFVDSERALAVEQDRLAESEGLVVLNLIRLNRALGGGWDPDAPEHDVAQDEAEQEGSSGEVR